MRGQRKDDIICGLVQVTMLFQSSKPSVYPWRGETLQGYETNKKQSNMEKKSETIAKPAGLYRKLLELQKAVRGLLPDANGGGQRNSYKYISGSKLLGHLRPKMNELGLLLKQEVIDISNDKNDYGTTTGMRSEMFTSIKMRFTWVDTDTGEKDENMFIANGQNGWDKGLGSALTYGERYFLLKFFHIPSDEDDVDALPIVEAMPAPAPVIQKRSAADFAVVEPGDKTYNKLMARIAFGQIDTVERALASGMKISENALALLTQAQRDYKPNQQF